MTSDVERSAAGDRAAEQALRVILVEDDLDLRQGVADYLRLSGIIVADVGSGLAFYRALRSERFDIAILDVNLPDTSGFELARDLASEGRMGVILLTARTGRDDRVRGYAEGTDLYLTKPVDGEELLLAVRNLARRVHDRRAASGAASVGPAFAGAWRLDVVRQRLLPPGGDPIHLSGRELLLLEYLIQANATTVSRAELGKHLGYADVGAESRSLDAVLRRLRQKASERGIEMPLRTVHAVGIRFSAPLVMLHDISGG
ncbi:response regulator transcription factor [Chelatococcus reniformis]|uniref:DNA-binding response regulator n=1 Tax=Chelatococcus reniformis TaxID=1494448 RepID=A0A916XH21_9HYPH|nr:response regulator transcription factor [Chelatococcus reniformis]GGC69928.1 hypothetical protein GCM10010994_30640 [Chelatococcus reniformis]